MEPLRILYADLPTTLGTTETADKVAKAVESLGFPCAVDIAFLSEISDTLEEGGYHLLLSPFLLTEEVAIPTILATGMETGVGQTAFYEKLTEFANNFFEQNEE